MSNHNSDSFFSLKYKTIREIFQNIASEIRDIFDDRGGYIKIRLPVVKITKDFEDKLKDKIVQKFIRAEIRVATKEDIDNIINIYNRAWHSSNMPFSKVSKEKFLKTFKDPNTVFLIARIDSIDGGFILLDFEGENREIGIIIALGIIPKFQHMGLVIFL